MMLDGILASGAIERELESLVGAEAAVDDAATSPARLPFAQHGPGVDPGREGADPRRTPRRAASEARRCARSGALGSRGPSAERESPRSSCTGTTTGSIEAEARPNHRPVEDGATGRLGAIPPATWRRR